MADGMAVADGEIQTLQVRIAELEAELEAERRRGAALRRSEELYRKLIDLSPDAIYVHDDHRRIVFMNPAGARLFGAESPDRLVGALATALVHPESRSTVDQHIDRVLSRNSTSVQLEQRRLRLDGTDFYADVVVAAITWNDAPAGLVVVRDVTERIVSRARARQAEENSQAAHARLADAIEAMPGGFAIYDAEERLILSNRRYAETIWPQCADLIRPGLTFETLVNETLRRGVWDAAGELKEELAAAALERHRNLPSESEIAYPDGRWVWQAKRRTSDGGVVAVYTDITESRRRQQRLAEQEALHRTLLENLPDAVVIHAGQRMVFANAAAVELFGADSVDQLLRIPSMGLVPPDYADIQRERRRLVLEERRTLPPVEQGRYRLDGSLIFVETASTFMMWEGEPAFVGVMRDVTARKQAKAELEEAHRRFEAITANIPGAVFQRALTPDGALRFPYISSGIQQILGVSAEEIMNDISPLADAMLPDCRDAYYQALRESAEKLTPFDMQFAVSAQDGRTRWLRSKGRPHRREDGAVVWEGLVVDVTEHHDIMERARRTHELLLAAIEAMPNAFLLWDPEDRLVMWNGRCGEFMPGFERLREGMHIDEVLAIPYEELKAEKGAAFADAWFAGRKRQQADAARSEIVQTAGGRWHSITKRRTPENFNVTVIADVTDPVQAAERLRESEARYRSLINLTPDCIYVHKGGELVVCNEAAVALFGATSTADLIGRQTSELIHPDFRDIARRRQGLVVAGGTCTTFMRQKRLRLDGTEFWADVAAAGVEWDGERGGIVVIRDVTDTMRAEEMLRRSKEEAELASRTKTEFLANVSHELRTPLNAIIGFSDIIQREMFGPLGNPHYLSYIRDIHQSGSHLHDVINDILDLSKVEAGKLELSEEEVNIAASVARCMRVVQPRAEEGRIALSARLDEKLPRVRGDARKIKQILINLLSNAVKFTEPGGSVTLSAALTPEGAVQIVIADTGIGMDAKGMKAAMQPFGQVDSALNRKYEGTGLGLPLTRALVELHGGTFEIDSAPGEGTRAIVRLPACRVLPGLLPASRASG
jgi:PAS domain S-box-containing protein